MKSQKNKQKNKKMSKKEFNDILEGEIIEKRKTSKSHDLPFKYKCEKTMKSYEVEITCMIFIQSANIIVTSSLDPAIEIWSFNILEINLKLVSILIGHTKSVICLKDFTNLKCIASCSYDQTLKLWDINKKKCLATLNYNSMNILTCCYNPNYKMEIFMAGEEEEIFVWGGSPINYNYNPKYKFKGHKNGINNLLFISDFNLLASGGKDQNLCFWDYKNKYSCVGKIYFGYDILCMKYFKKRLMVSCSDGNINFINMNILQKIKSIQFGNIPICDFEIIGQQKYLLMGCADGKVRLWKISSNNRALLLGHTKAVISVGVADTYKDYIITASKDMTIKIWKKYVNLDYK